MIKKIIYLLTIIIAISIANLSYQFINNNDYSNINAVQDYIAIKESKETKVLEIAFNKENVKLSIEKIITFCKSYQMTMSMVTNKNNQGVSITNYYVYGNNENLFDELKIDEKKAIDFSNTNHEQYYTTMTNDNNSNGKIVTIQKNFFNNYFNQFNVCNMGDIENVIKNNGYKIMSYFYLDNKSEEYEKLLNMFESEEISVNNITDGYFPAQLEFLNKEGISRIQTILVLSIVLMGFLMCLYSLKQKHKIMIKRLNGVSIIRIMIKEIGLFFFINILVFIVTMFITTLLLCGIIQFWNKDLYMLNINMVMAYIALHVLLCMILYIFIYLTSHIKYLKKNFAISHFMETTVLLKVIIIALVLPQLIPLTNDIVKNIGDYFLINKNQTKIENSAYFFSDLNSSDTTDLIFNYYIQHGGQYVDFNYYASNQEEYLKSVVPEEYWYQLDESIINYPMIYANANYLKEHNIKDVQGNIIDLKQFKEDVLLVPQRYAKEELNKAMYSQKREIIYIQDSDSYLNFQLDDPLRLSSPVIHLVTKKSSEVSLTYMYLPTQEKSIAEYQLEIENMGGGDADIKNFDNIVSSRLEMIEEKIKETIIILSIYIVFMMVLIYQSVYLYIHENQLKISLGYMNGYSRWQRYQELFIYIPLTYIFIFLTGFFILHLSIMALLVFCLISMGVEILTHFIMIHRFESKNISAILKGESEL